MLFQSPQKKRKCHFWWSSATQFFGLREREVEAGSVQSYYVGRVLPRRLLVLLGLQIAFLSPKGYLQISVIIHSVFKMVCMMKLKKWKKNLCLKKEKFNRSNSYSFDFLPLPQPAVVVTFFFLAWGGGSGSSGSMSSAGWWQAMDQKEVVGGILVSVTHKPTNVIIQVPLSVDVKTGLSSHKLVQISRQPHVHKAG